MPAAVAVTAVIAALVWHRAAPLATATQQVTLLYVGAEDCAPCRLWQRGEGASFLASPEFAQIKYREVKPPSLRDVLADAYWPDDLRTYRDRLDRKAGVPLWLVIADREVVEQAFGASRWRSAVLPRLKLLLR